MLDFVTVSFVIVSFKFQDQAYLKILVEMIHLVGRLATVKVGRLHWLGDLQRSELGDQKVRVGRPRIDFFFARSLLSKSYSADRTRHASSDLHRLWP